MWTLLFALFAGNASALPSNLSQWLQETNRLVPPPPVVDSGRDPTKSGVFHWASYRGKDPYPVRVVSQQGSGVERFLRVDSIVPMAFSYEICACYPCAGSLESICDWKRFKNVWQTKVFPHYPFEFGRFFFQRESRPSPFPWHEGVENQSLTDTLSFRVERDSKGRIRKTISGYDRQLDKDITLFQALQDSLGRDTAVIHHEIHLDTFGKVRNTRDWYREHRSYDSLGRLSTYWIEDDLKSSPEDLRLEGCLETQYLYDKRGFNHVQIHRTPLEGRVVAVSDIINNREGRPVHQKVGYLQKGKVVDWLVGNFWQYDSLSRLTYRVQYTNPKWIGKSDAEGFFFRSNCNWWNRP